MVYMRPRQQALPKPQRSRRNEFSYGVVPTYPKSDERPSIIGSNGQGRGIQGEHSNGGNNSGGSDAVELWRTNYMRRQWGTK